MSIRWSSPCSVNNTFGMEFINSIEQIVEKFKGIHTACGLSNISYGLPGRKYVNRAFMVQAIAKGLDGAIVTAEALSGKDNFCMNYLKAFRGGLLDG